MACQGRRISRLYPGPIRFDGERLLFVCEFQAMVIAVKSFASSIIPEQGPSL